MKIRRAVEKDLPSVLRLYRFLQPTDPVLDPEAGEVRQHWRAILDDQRLRYFVAEIEGGIVSSCALTLIPNLTRGMRPYGVIENVVTDPAHRRRGFATAVLRTALEEAWGEGCYKVLLSTGSTQEETLHFYERAGFLRGVKTGFIAYPPSSPAVVVSHS